MGRGLIESQGRETSRKQQASKGTNLSCSPWGLWIGAQRREAQGSLPITGKGGAGTP